MFRQINFTFPRVLSNDPLRKNEPSSSTCHSIPAIRPSYRPHLLLPTASRTAWVFPVLSPPGFSAVTDSSCPALLLALLRVWSIFHTHQLHLAVSVLFTGLFTLFTELFTELWSDDVFAKKQKKNMLLVWIWLTFSLHNSQFLFMSSLSDVKEFSRLLIVSLEVLHSCPSRTTKLFVFQIVR